MKPAGHHATATDYSPDGRFLLFMTWRDGEITAAAPQPVLQPPVLAP